MYKINKSQQKLKEDKRHLFLKHLESETKHFSWHTDNLTGFSMMITREPIIKARAV